MRKTRMSMFIAARADEKSTSYKFNTEIAKDNSCGALLSQVRRDPTDVRQALNSNAI